MRLDHNDMPSRGVTLVELLVVLVIIGILLLLVVPISTNFMQQNQLLMATNQVMTVINDSRTLAMTMGQTMTLAPLHDDDWSSGMKLYSQDQLLQVWQWPNTTIKIYWNGFISDDYLQFPGDGINGAMNGTFYLCVIQHPDTMAKTIVINRLGRARVGDTNQCPS